MTAPPASADVAVVGGGIFGCSVAWHLLRADPTLRVVVLERHERLATQATSQAAALLTRARSKPGQMALVARTYAAIEELGDVLGEPVPLARVGTLHVAGCERTAADLAALEGIAAARGLAVEHIPPDDLPALVPWLEPSAVERCALMPDDGITDACGLAERYAKAARIAGAAFHTGVVVGGLAAEGGRVTGVETDRGPVVAPRVVLAAGAWANLLAAPLGFPLPMAPVRSQYWITEPDPLFPRRHPAVILPDASAYTRPEVGALLFGLRERAAVSADPRALPAETNGYAFEDDPEGWAALEPGAPALQRFFPALERIAIRHHLAGFSTYTPDGAFVLGPAPDIGGVFVASGCCGAGIAVSGGVGEVLAALVLGRQPPVDLAPFDPARFGSVDPFDPAFRATCAAARSRKTAG